MMLLDRILPLDWCNNTFSNIGHEYEFYLKITQLEQRTESQYKAITPCSLGENHLQLRMGLYGQHQAMAIQV